MPNIIQIHDASLPELDVFSRLTEAQLRNKKEPEKGLFIAESPKVIERALNAGYEPVALLMEQKHTSVKDIAYLCGFSEQLYFSRVFRKKMGMSRREHMKTLI